MRFCDLNSHPSNPTEKEHQRIDLILDLTRRIQLLEDLMLAARVARSFTDEGMPLLRYETLS